MSVHHLRRSVRALRGAIIKQQLFKFFMFPIPVGLFFFVYLITVNEWRMKYTKWMLARNQFSDQFV